MNKYLKTYIHYLLQNPFIYLDIKKLFKFGQNNYIETNKIKLLNGFYIIKNSKYLKPNNLFFIKFSHNNITIINNLSGNFNVYYEDTIPTIRNTFIVNNFKLSFQNNYILYVKSNDTSFQFNPHNHLLVKSNETYTNNNFTIILEDKFIKCFIMNSLQINYNKKSYHKYYIYDE